MSNLIKHIQDSSGIICILAPRVIFFGPESSPVTPAPSSLLILSTASIYSAASRVTSAQQVGSDACQCSRPPKEIKAKNQANLHG